MKKILLVEDDAPTAELVRALLLRNGYEVFHCKTGTEALPMAGKNRPDLVILDLRLPGMDGHAVQSELYRDEKTRDIPILLVTVDNQLEQDFAGAKNVAGFLAKPFDVMEFQAKVKSVLEKGLNQ